jgi:Zn-dependent protease
MFPSWRIGRPFGINLFVHWTFWLLPIWVLLTARPGPGEPPVLVQLGLVLALFVCVVLHELGHAVAARGFGIPTRRILLTPIGGIAQFTQLIRTPWAEFVIAGAGPLVNVVIALVLGALTGGLALVWPAWPHTGPGSFVTMLVVLNVMMALFNLLPAFPMDGGRVLRAILSHYLGPVRATRAAVATGTIVAVLLGAAGVVYLQSPWPIVIAAFVIWTGHRELAGIEAEERQRVEEARPLVMPLRSTFHWPGAGAPSVFVWDAERGRWVRAEGP